MNFGRLHKSLTFGIAMLALAGCTKPHDPPHFEGFNAAKNAEFPGVIELAAPSVGGNARVFWVHGMCHHTWKWAEKRAHMLKRAVDSTVPADVPEIADAALLAPRPGPSLQLIEKEIKTNAGAIDATFVVWSSYTRPFKDQLDYDSYPNANRDDGPEYIRASLNQSLKAGLLNDCLADAVVYVGKNGDAIRTAFQKAICENLGGSYQDNAVCTFNDDGLGRPLVLVSESLGSKLVMDAVRALWDATEAGPSPSPERVALSAKLLDIRGFFLLSNQVPLLDLTDRGAPASVAFGAAPNGGAAARRSSISDFLDVLDEADAIQRQGALAPPTPRDPLIVVSFTDPNDLLSYRMTPAGLGRDDLALVNVLVSNANTYFGLLERPDHAHCGYEWNPYVNGLLAKGRSADAPLPKVDIKSKSSCLN